MSHIVVLGGCAYELRKTVRRKWGGGNTRQSAVSSRQPHPNSN